MSSVILYITVAERSAKSRQDVRIITDRVETRENRHDRSLTGFIVIINRDGCWFGFLHHGRLVNFERKPNFVNLKNKNTRELVNIVVCNMDKPSHLDHLKSREQKVSLHSPRQQFLLTRGTSS